MTIVTLALAEPPFDLTRSIALNPVYLEGGTWDAPSSSGQWDSTDDTAQWDAATSDGEWDDAVEGLETT